MRAGDNKVNGFTSVSIDSRTVQAGALFVALSGLESDGHSFVEAAFTGGAVAAMVEQKKLESYDLPGLAKTLGKTLIVVENTLRGLQKTAKVYLEKFPGLLKIGITGSSGKTTTKEIAAAIIGQEKKIVMNQGNYNSETGLPLAVFAVRPCHEVGIFEMGMNRQGEIADLANVLKPDIALVTNVGSAHIGILGTKEGIAKEKKNIFSLFDEHNIALIPEDSVYRDFLAEGVQGRVSFYGEKSFSELGGIMDFGLRGSEIIWDGKPARFALPGRFNISNAFAAIALALEIPVSSAAVRKGLESVKPLFGRSEIFHGRITIIRDCYNSNPESLGAALEFCEQLEWPGRRIYVIGEMLELGGISQKAHEDIARSLSGSKAKMVFLYGQETKVSAELLSGSLEVFHTCEMDELSRALGAYVKEGDLVLLKGSRGCALENLHGVLASKGGD
jgi:UDP-N-acetylmuramoyl-tripeptide--D-alanyl-D-alanine ligase